MTLEAWVYPTSNPMTWTTVITKERPEVNNLVYGLFADSPQNTSLVNVVTNTGLTEVYGPTNSSIPVNTWTHLAGTYDAVNGQSLYVNGVEVAHARPYRQHHYFDWTSSNRGQLSLFGILHRPHRRSARLQSGVESGGNSG